MTQSTEDTDGLDGAPWYLRVLVRVGLPTAFASALLWFLLSNVTGSLTSMQQMQADNAHTQASVISNQQKIIELMADHAQMTVETTRYLQALCLNAAKTADERSRCIDAASWTLRSIKERP